MHKLRIKSAVAIAIIFSLSPMTAVANEAHNAISELSEANRHAAETSAHITDVSAQLAQVQGRIAQTQAEIADTNAAIADAKIKLAASQATLGSLVREEYQRNNTTKIEQLVGSKTFSDFVDRQQYLKAGQDKIAEATNAVVASKRIMDAKAVELGKLNAELANQQNGLAFAKAQAEGKLAEINAARSALKAKLARYSGGRVVNAGDKVNAGDLIGFEGSSGCSTGSHLHFEVLRNGSPVNPRSVVPGQMRWPHDAGFHVNQEFGRPNWSAPYDFHGGVDTSQYFGAPIYAAASGTVTFSGYDRSGFGDHVKISHSGGLESIYGHLGARASDYPNC